MTIIVPVRNEATSLPRCLASLLAQDHPAERLEILVVDGLSEDGTAEIARKILEGAGTASRVLANAGRTAAAAMNLGLRAARGDVILRLDGHAEAAQDFVRRSVEALARTGADCVGGPIATVGDGATGRAIAAAMSSPFGVGDAAFRTTRDREMDVDTVAFPAYRRDAFGRVGVFDATFVRNQDDEFHLRLARAGLRIVLVPAIRSVYRCRGTIPALARQYFGYGLWKPAILRKHGRLPALRALAPPLFVAALAASALAAAATRDPAWLAVPAGPYLVANLALSCVVAAREGRDLLARLPFAFATLHVAYGAGFLAGLFRRRPEAERDRVRRAFARRDSRALPRPRDAAMLAARRRDVRALLTDEGALPAAGARILDVGCGRGDSLATFSPDVALFGVDLLEERVAAVGTKAARLVVGDALVLPFRDGAFDVCTLFTVLSSIKDDALRRRVAAESLRVLRPGGVLVVHEFSLHPWNPDVRGVPASTLRRLFPGCRTTVRRTLGPYPPLPTHYVALVRRPEEPRR